MVAEPSEVVEHPVLRGFLSGAQPDTTAVEHDSPIPSRRGLPELPPGAVHRKCASPLRLSLERDFTARGLGRRPEEVEELRWFDQLLIGCLRMVFQMAAAPSRCPNCASPYWNKKRVRPVPMRWKA